MKTISNLSIYAIGMFFIMAFTSINSVRLEQPITLTPKPLELKVEVPEIKAKELELPTNRHVDFLDALGQKESGNNYKIVNKYGYLGRYQFGKSTLKGLGYKVTPQEFLDSPALQEEAMHKLLVHNKKKLQKYIDKYEGQVLHGVYITESGVLAAAHLGGAGNVRRFFRKGSQFKDGFGTTITSYMKKFSGYELDI